ncbi:MAG: DUF559 domain-containing protein [Candidatus Paceibacterota bacterium]|jgi:very-short-patch-repair endonuclease
MTFANYYHKLKPRARELRKQGILAEVLFWRQIKAKKFGYHFYRQKPLSNYIVDFYCPALKLVVEIDGSSHQDKKQYDKLREEFLQSIGLRVIRFSDAEIKDNIHNVIKILKEKILE